MFSIIGLIPAPLERILHISKEVVFKADGCNILVMGHNARHEKLITVFISEVEDPTDRFIEYFFCLIPTASRYNSFVKRELPLRALFHPTTELFVVTHPICDAVPVSAHQLTIEQIPADYLPHRASFLLPRFQALAP